MDYNEKLNSSTAAKIFSLAADYAEEYVENIRERRVSPSKQELDGLQHFDDVLPEDGNSAENIITALHEYGSPATVASTGGRYFGLVVGGSTPASMGASVLTTAWDQVAVLESSAPSAIYLERIAAGWLLELLGLQKESSVGFTTGTSVANMVCLAAARNELYRKQGIDLALHGLSGSPPLRIIVSEQAHVTVFKALSLLGIGTSQIVKAPCDKQGRIMADTFPNVDENTIVCLQAGNVNSGGSDPFEEIIPLAKAKGAWVHVDGAFGLWVAVSPNKKHLIKGVELADSWAVDAHKWLNTPYDCGVAICSNAQAVHQVMTTQAPYLTTDLLVPPKDMVPEFSRRARGVEVWAAIQEMGRSGIADLIDRCCAHAQSLSKGLNDLGYDILNDVVMNQVVATIGSDQNIDDILRMVQEEGVCWFGKTVWNGKAAIRLSVASWVTNKDDIVKTLESIKRATNSVMSEVNVLQAVGNQNPITVAGKFG